MSIAVSEGSRAEDSGTLKGSSSRSHGGSSRSSARNHHPQGQAARPPQELHPASNPHSTDDLDEGDILFSGGADDIADRPSSSGHLSLTVSPARHHIDDTSASPSTAGGLVLNSSSPPHGDRRGVAIPQASVGTGCISPRWEEEDAEDDEDQERAETHQAPFEAGAPSSLRPDMRQRVNLNCRRSNSSQLALSFSLSFQNHAGVRRKVAFLYDLVEDEPVRLANEMMEDLQLQKVSCTPIIPISGIMIFVQPIQS